MKRPNQTTHRHLIFGKGSVYMKKGFARGSVALVNVICAVTGLLIGVSPASAASPDADLPIVAELISTTELAAIGQSQDPAEITDVMALASATQPVQVLMDLKSGTYSAAVLVEFAPGFSTSSNQRSVPDQVQPFAGVYGCSTTAARGVSSHVAPERQIGWCGNGNWTGPAIGGTYRFQNKSGTTATIGENWIIAALCPGYTTCNFASSFNLRYVAY